MRARTYRTPLHLLAFGALIACGSAEETDNPWLARDGLIDAEHVSADVLVLLDGGEVTVRDHDRTVLLAPFPGTWSTPRDVWASSVDDVYVAGSRLSHWNGSERVDLELPGPVGDIEQRSFDSVCGCPDGSRWVATSLWSEAGVLYRVHGDGTLERVSAPEGAEGDWIGGIECDASALWVSWGGTWVARVDGAWLDVESEAVPRLATGDRVVFEEWSGGAPTQLMIEEFVGGELVRSEIDLALPGHDWETIWNTEGSYSRVSHVVVGAPEELWMAVEDVDVVLQTFSCTSPGSFSSATYPCDQHVDHVTARHLFHRVAGAWREVERALELPLDAGPWSTPEAGVLEIWIRGAVITVRDPE